MNSNWEEERQKFFKNKGVELEKLERRRIEEGDWFKKIIKGWRKAKKRKVEKNFELGI